MQQDLNNHLYKIIKISSEKIAKHKTTKKNSCLYDIGMLSYDDAILTGEIVTLADNQVLHKIRAYHKEHSHTVPENNFVSDIVNVVVPENAGKSKAAEKDFQSIATVGFIMNGIKYIRFCSGSGQIRRNTVTFIDKCLYEYMVESLSCGLYPENFREFNIAKYNAYFGLNMSGVHFLSNAPRVCIIDDFEQIRPHQRVNHIETVIDKDGKTKTVNKIITTPYYDSMIDGEYRFKPLNSFDGQGLCSPAYAKRIAMELGYNYLPSQYIIRAPWVKGLIATFDFKAYCTQYNVTQLKDIFGDTHNVSDVDLLLSKSQFKMWKIYAEHGGWKYHVEAMRKYNLKWGVVKPNKQTDDDYKTLNYQYINALSLDNTDIDELCAQSEMMLQQLCNGDINKIYKALIQSSDDEADCDANDEETTSMNYQSFLQKAVSHNVDLLQDEHIQKLVYDECKARFKSAKIGKILCRGNYQFLVSDPVAQMQAIILAHAQDGNVKSVNVAGLIPPNMVYSNYWNRTGTDKIVMMRSPMIDQSEVAVRTLVLNEDASKWYAFLKSGIIVSVWDLTPAQMQGCDWDGDIAFSSNMPVLINGALDNPLPLVYPVANTEIKGTITPENLIAADVRGLNSRVGSISNKAASFYAKLPLYDKNSGEYRELINRIKILGELVCVEIDRIKTSIPPETPTSWKWKDVPKQTTYIDGKLTTVPTISESEIQNIYRRNDLMPDDKPYFFRYIYSSIGNDITSYQTNFNKESQYNYLKKLDDLLEVPFDKLSETEQRTVQKYKKYFPVNDSDCTMNKICHRFEKMEKHLAEKCTKDTMLKQFVTEQPINHKDLDRVVQMIALYKAQRRMLTQMSKYNNYDNGHNMANKMKEHYNHLYEYIRCELFKVFDGNVQSAFNHVIAVMNQTGGFPKHFIWNIFDENIFDVIPSKKFEEVEC